MHSPDWPYLTYHSATIGVYTDACMSYYASYAPNPRVTFFSSLPRPVGDNTNTFPPFSCSTAPRTFSAQLLAPTKTAGHPPRISTTNLVGGASAAPDHKPPQPAKVIRPQPPHFSIHQAKHRDMCSAPRKQLRGRPAKTGKRDGHPHIGHCLRRRVRGLVMRPQPAERRSRTPI
jgi:hypothetical protein